MEKRFSVKVNRTASSDERFWQLEDSELREVMGRGRVRIPIGYTETGDPIYGEDEGSGSEDDG